jgi:mannose/fructose/N-acetylgalactosamine-specific phosphotransferase system component IIC
MNSQKGNGMPSKSNYSGIELLEWILCVLRLLVRAFPAWRQLFFFKGMVMFIFLKRPRVLAGIAIRSMPFLAMLPCLLIQALSFVGAQYRNRYVVFRVAWRWADGI